MLQIAYQEEAGEWKPVSVRVAFQVDPDKAMDAEIAYNLNDGTVAASIPEIDYDLEDEFAEYYRKKTGQELGPNQLYEKSDYNNDRPLEHPTAEKVNQSQIEFFAQKLGVTVDQLQKMPDVARTIQAFVKNEFLPTAPGTRMPQIIA